MPAVKFPVSSDMRALTVLSVSLLPVPWIRMALLVTDRPSMSSTRGSPPRGAERSCFFSISSTMIPATFASARETRYVMQSWERSFDAAGQGAVALNRKIIDIAQRNINSSFDLAKSLAGAKNLAEAVEMQSAYWRKQFDTLAAQAEEVRTLSTQVAADAAKPIEGGIHKIK